MVFLENFVVGLFMVDLRVMVNFIGVIWGGLCICICVIYFNFYFFRDVNIFLSFVIV